MNDPFDRKSFRVGQGGYEVLQQPQETEGEKEKEGREDGRGDATAHGNPKIQEGDELYDVLFQERAERMRSENIVSRSEQHNGSGGAFLAVLAGEAASQDQQEPSPQPGRFPAEAQAEVTQPSADHQGPASLDALRVEQAQAAPQPVPNGLPDYVSEETAQKVGAQHQQPEQVQEQDGPTRPGTDMGDYVSEGTMQKVAAEQSQQRSNINSLTM